MRLISYIWNELVLRTLADVRGFAHAVLTRWRTLYGVLEPGHSLFQRCMALHHVGVAAIVALVVLQIEHVGGLNWLENATLRVAATMQRGAVPAAEPVPANAEDARVLVLSATLYENAFQQTSPLNRPNFAALLKSIAEASPKALVVDLDLAPVADAAGNDDPLDKQLLDFSKHGTTLILATPFPVHTEEAFKRRYAWMSKMCAAGVIFADARLPLTQGINLRYFKGHNTLGDLAFATLFPHVKAEPNTLIERFYAWLFPDAKAAPSLPAPCELVKEGEAFAVFLDAEHGGAKEHQAAAHFAEQVHLDAATLRRTHARVKPLNHLASPLCLDLRGGTVFLGGAYDNADRFQTVIAPEPLPGVVVHAAAYNAARHNPGRITTALALMVDILIGTLMGMLFHYTWARYNGAGKQLERVARGEGRKAGAYVMARLWLVINFALVVLIVWSILGLSATLLDRHWWSNPAPVVVGIFVKSLLGSRSHLLATDAGHGHASHASAHGDHHAPQWLVLSDLALVALLLVVLINYLGH